MKSKVWNAVNGDELKLLSINRNIDGAHISVNGQPPSWFLIYEDRQGEYILHIDEKFYLETV